MDIASMNDVEMAVLRQDIGEVSPRLSIRSVTRIDAGLWCRRVPLWLLVLDRELVLLAAGRRRYVGRVPFEAASGSHYDHQTAALVIAPVEDLPFNQVAMTVADAVRVLRCLGIEP